MFTFKRIICGSLFAFLLATTILSQENRAPIDNSREPVPAATAGPMVTATATAKRVRFVSPATVVQLRLEVYNEAGQKLFDTELHGGNVLDWHLQDGAGERLPAGSYASLLTIKSLSGRLSQRVGLVTVNNEEAAIVATGAGELSMAQQQAIGPVAGMVEGSAGFTVLQQSDAEALTTVTHDGTQGQLSRTRGPLSFRVGDVFSGNDKEQMRLTEDGRLGIGTSDPQAKLDVAGTIRAERVLIAKPAQPGSAKQTGDLAQAGEEQPLATGSGSLDRIAKWTDNAGTLGDSGMTETGGQVGIGTSNPASLLHLAGPGGVSAITLNSPGTHRFRFQTVPGVPNWGALTLNANYNSGWHLDDPTINGWFFKLNTQGGNASNDNNGLWLYRVPPGANPHTDESAIFGVSSGHAYFAGNLGIGTNNPGTKLDVVGKINTSTQYDIGGSRVLSVAGLANTFAGIGAGTSSTGDSNSFFGRNAGGGLNNSGSTNSFFGERAGAGNTTGFGNSFFGNTAGLSNTTGRTNSFFGVQAGQSNTTGFDNSYFGVQAGFSNTGGTFNSFFGRGAGAANTASNNSFFGTSAGTANTSGDDNSFFGSGAGDSVTSGANNAFFGRSAGAANTTGSNITLLGGSANVGVGNLSNATAIGANALVTQSNSLVLGNGVNVGIGTTSPNFKLHVVGGSDAEPGSGGYIVAGLTTSTNLVIDNNEIMARNSGAAATLALNADGGNVNLIQGGTGDVGIGTSTPGAKLDVNGTARANSLEVNGGAFRVLGAGMNTNTAAFIHVATAANVLLSGIDTVLDHPLLNNNPNAMLFVTVRQSDSPYLDDRGIKALYSTLAPANRWRIRSNGADIEVGQQFNVLIIIP